MTAVPDFKTVTCRFSSDQESLLKIACRIEGVGQSDLIREAVTEVCKDIILRHTLADEKEKKSERRAKTKTGDTEDSPDND